jgi:hypothetical protein
VLPAAHHHLNCALITASKPLPEEVQVEAKAQEVINTSQILTQKKPLNKTSQENHNTRQMSIYLFV